MVIIMEPSIYKKQVYTIPEKKLFLKILKKYSKVVENKRYHSSVLKLKNLAWHKIASEFNSSPQITSQRTPKQLRRLWTNLKNREKEAVARTLSPQSTTPMDDVYILVASDNNSIDSDMLDTTTKDVPEFLESFCEESQNICNEGAPIFSPVKTEPMSPSITDPVEIVVTPILNPTLTPNNKAHITQQPDNQDGTSRLQGNLELQALEIKLLEEKLRYQREENNCRVAHAAAVHSLECQILEERLREAKAKADLAELHLRKQQYSDGNDSLRGVAVANAAAAQGGASSIPARCKYLYA